jgi:stress-induced-phosphoprotein 1
MKQTTRALEQIQRASDAEDSSAHAREINELENKISRALYEERANETEEDVMRR